MDINSLINTRTLLTSIVNPLNLKIGQQLEVKLVNAQICATQNEITLAFGGNKDITVKTNQPLSIDPGQNLKIQVTQTTPTIEFKIVPSSPEQKNLPPDLRLTLIANTAKSSLPVNQPLEINKTGPTPEFKFIPTASNISEAKVADYIKQFLPRHEASPILLNQLITDLPQLMANESVSKTLKEIAAQIIQNLPPKEQLITKQGIRLAINNSGLFLEAKLSASMAELPQLINNESVPLSLQRIAAEIVQNLTQKLPFVNNSEPEPVSPNAVNTNDKEVSTQALEEMLAPNLTLSQPEDFKANLLKLIHALKQELSQQNNKQPLQQTDLDLLKNLQNKSENTVAKLVLDQLMSAPTDNNPKQIWMIDIPFIDRQQAQSVKIEIQQDRENQQQYDSHDWSVNITVTPPKLETIHCIVSYRNHVINTFFKSHDAQTTELIKLNLDYLKQQLEDSGLTTGHMDAHADSQKISVPPPQLAGKKLFDDKA